MGLPTDAFKSLVVNSYPETSGGMVLKVLIQDISRKLACRHLDAGLSWKEQDGRALKRYDDEVGNF